MSKILLAVTESSSQELEHALKGLGAELIFARDGQELLDLAREIRPDLIILERNIPVLDGLSALLLLKNDKQTKEIPIVALCEGNCAQEQAELAHDAGCDAHLTRPLNADKIKEILKNFLKR